MSKKKRKKAQKAVRWATAQLPVLSHDTMECIVTQGLVGQHSAQQARKGLSHDTAGRITILPARARDTTPRCCDTAGQKHNTARSTRPRGSSARVRSATHLRHNHDTASHRLRHDRGTLMTRRQCVPRHDATRPSQRAACAQPRPWVCTLCT